MTMRASRVSDGAVLPFGLLEGALGMSMIIKFAPPYVAGVGPELPFSPDRQRNEAAALSLFSPPPPSHNVPNRSPGPSPPARNDLDLLCSDFTAVSIPKLYHFSESEHLIVMEDLGKLRNLEEWLQLPQELHRVRDVGTRLSHFVGRLHSADASAIPPHASFESRIGQDLVKTAIVDTLPDYLSLFDIPNRGRLQEIVVEAHDQGTNRNGSGLHVFSVGDFWPPSILLDDDKDRVCIVDWEFAGYAPPMQDMA